MTGVDGVHIIPIRGMGEIAPGDDLAQGIFDAIKAGGWQIKDGDVVVITQKIVSKAEGRVVEARDDDAKQSLVASEAVRILRRRRGLVIAQTSHGFVCANAGVDSSNLPEGHYCLLPRDPDRSARRLRRQLGRLAGATPAVIISDTFGRPWRVGQTNVAIGVAGLQPLIDYRGSNDSHGKALHATLMAVADELAGAAELVMGKADGIPAAVVRGAHFHEGKGKATQLIRATDADLFR